MKTLAVLLATMTPDQAVSISSGWITAIFTILSLIFAACVGFWAKYGAVIQGLVAAADRHSTQISTLQLNAPPPVTGGQPMSMLGFSVVPQGALGVAATGPVALQAEAKP